MIVDEGNSPPPPNPTERMAAGNVTSIARTQRGNGSLLSGRVRGCLTALAIIALTLCLLGFLVRAHAVTNIVELIGAVGSPYVLLIAMGGLAVSALCRRMVLSVVSIVVLTTSLAVQVPWYYFGSWVDVGSHAGIRILSSNLQKGHAYAPPFVGLAKDKADVIAVAELTPDEVQRFSRAGIEEAFPFFVLKPASGAGGTGIWSRFPLTPVELEKKHRPHTNVIAARLQVPNARFDPLVASVHITSPVTAESGSLARWRSGIAGTKAFMDNLAEEAGEAAVVVAGDFNSTPDMRQFRDLLTNGYRDAVEQTGAGFAPTFPSNKWFPPVLVIDHVLTRNAAASSIRTVSIPGSDHRALLATIKVPVEPTEY